MFDVYKSPVGNILIESDTLAITQIKFIDSIFYYKTEENVLSRTAKTQLSQYFEGRRHKFDLPLRPLGTPFQKIIWNELMKIPFGETKTCSEIASLSGGTPSVLSVGMAAGKNPIAIVIPCHRITENNGSTARLIKDFLIKHEKTFVGGNL